MAEEFKTIVNKVSEGPKIRKQSQWQSQLQ